MADHNGYVVGNSAIAAEISSNGPRFKNIGLNPSSFEHGKNGLAAAGSVSLRFGLGALKEALWQPLYNTYPKYEAETELSQNVSMRLCAFAPVTPFDSHDLFLPAIVVRIAISNLSQSAEAVTVAIDWDKGEQTLSSFLFYAFKRTFECARQARRVIFSVPVKGGETVTLVLGFGAYHENNEWRNRFPDCEGICKHIAQSADWLERGIDTFISLIPDLGDETLRDYTAWYLQAAVLLTKSAKDGNVITMGYHELNTRDSFWTSFLHLIMFPELERRMIEITAAHQRGDGKIPTTVLPTIERETDLDINEYFCLRIARYFRFHRDTEFLKKLFGTYQKSVEYLIARDKDGDGLPEQEPESNPENIWCDWKDVRFISGRKLSPHVCLLWLAVLKEGAYLARELGEEAIAACYECLYKKAYEKVNADYTGDSDGGLWCGTHYNEVWYDGKRRIHVLQDQCVGMFFGVIEKERAEKIYGALKQNDCAYGIRETFPYRTEQDVLYTKEHFDEGGLYHNGGVWPWLNFMDIAGRYRSGRAAEAEEIFRKMGYYDLVASNDYRPNEYLNGEAGKNMGFELQGWSAAVVASVYFGAFEISWREENVSVKCNLPRSLQFSTRLILPRGKVVEFVSDGTGKVFGIRE